MNPFRLAFTAAAFAIGAAAQEAPKAVLVTGASSGIGRRVTERLAEKGYFVYAGARSQKDLDDLAKLRNVQPLKLDVTVQADIDAAVATVTKAGRGLYGIVNNAGVAVVGPLIELDEKDLDFIFNVNIYGAFRITKAFAPLVIAAKGRVVNISSLNGIVTSAFIGPYSMSKHATEAYGDGLAAELGPLGVRVSTIEPGNYGTEIGKNMLARLDTTRFKGSRFEQQWRRTVASMAQFETYPPPDDVADAVFDAFSSATPRARYLVVPVAGQATIALRKLMDEIVQMNDSQKFTLDRDALVRMLDAAIASARR
ncbi:MAG TPA: SDR family oxidoreductase [Gemmatimonadaceae bacterium]|nr:SDR family oxidoreductase [Gemmatimonadaceae bacterium]